MAVLRALRQTPRALARNPVVFVPVLALLVLQVPQFVLQSVSPLLGVVASLGLSLVFLIAVPFFQAGMVGIADEALDGRTSLKAFVDAGKSNYLSLLVAYLALIAINFVLGTIGFVAALSGGVFFFDGGGLASIPTSVLVVVGVALALVTLAYLAVVFLVQFYGQAIVVDGFDAVDGLKHSVKVVRRNLASTLGYTVLVTVLGGVAGLVFGIAGALTSPGAMAGTTAQFTEPSLGVVVAGAALVAVFGTAFGGFFSVYSVAFYRAIAE